jgi:hypothetical protein
MRVLDVRRETKHGVGAVLKCRVAFWGCECWITTGLRCSESSMRRRRSGIISDAGLLQLDMEHPCIYYNINGSDRPITCHLASAQCLFPSMKPPNICISYSARDQPTNQPIRNPKIPTVPPVWDTVWGKGPGSCKQSRFLSWSCHVPAFVGPRCFR